jgi:hypothetical protein
MSPLEGVVGNDISLQHFNQTVFEQIIVLFDLEYFIKINDFSGIFLFLYVKW